MKHTDLLSHITLVCTLMTFIEFNIHNQLVDVSTQSSLFQRVFILIGWNLVLPKVSTGWSSQHNFQWNTSISFLCIVTE